MARFFNEIPYEIISQLDKIAESKMLEEMLEEAGKVVFEKVKSNLKKSFESTQSLEKGLKITRVYRTPSDDGINVFVGFYGYTNSKKPVKVSKTSKSGKKYTYEREGIPIPLIAIAREYGTSRGEKKKPFLRKAFKKSEIESIMEEVQKKYIEE